MHAPLSLQDIRDKERLKNSITYDTIYSIVYKLLHKGKDCHRGHKRAPVLIADSIRLYIVGLGGAWG